MIKIMILATMARGGYMIAAKQVRIVMIANADSAMNTG
jgi:hypothetical protein